MICLNALSTIQAQAKTPDIRDSIIELIFAGNALVDLSSKPGNDPNSLDCICGVRLSPVRSIPIHAPFCPVARFYAAVETARKAAL